MASDFIYGFYYAQIAFRSSAGYPIGDTIDPDNFAKAATTHSYLLDNPVSYTAPAPSFARAIDRGGQKIRAQRDMGVSDFGTGTIVLSEFDDIFHSYVTGGTVDSTAVTGWRQTGSNVNQVSKPEFFLIVSTQADDVLNSVSMWSHWIYPNCQILPVLPGASQSDGENPNPLEYTIVPNTSLRALTGQLFSGLGMGLTDDTDLLYRMQTSNPIGITTYREDATPANAFVLGYRPLTDETDVTDKDITTDGASETYTTCNVTTAAVTTTGVTDGQLVVSVYETIYTAI